MHKSVFAIIVTYNGEKWIETCLDSLRRSNYPLQTIVVDNRSSDNTVNIIKEKFPEVVLIEASENHGFGKANNMGIKMALEKSADYVFLLNQDARITPETIETLIDAMQNNPDFGVLSPVHYAFTTDYLDSRFETYLRKFNKHREVHEAIDKAKKVVIETPFVNAAIWLIGRICLEKVGGFDPLFFHYGEDEDYIERLRFFNIKLGVVTNSIAFHDRDQRNEHLLAISPEKRMGRRLNVMLLKSKKMNKPLFYQIIRSYSWILYTCLRDIYHGYYLFYEYLFLVGAYTRRLPEIVKSRQVINDKKGFYFIINK